MSKLIPPPYELYFIRLEFIIVLNECFDKVNGSNEGNGSRDKVYCAIQSGYTKENDNQNNTHIHAR